MNFKKLKILLLFILFLFPLNFVSADEIEDISSKNVILYNLNDDSVLYEKDSNNVTLIASMTKIMTSIVALENIKDLDETVVLNDSIFNSLSSDLSMAGFKRNEKVTYRDLIYGALLPSGADATHSLAIFISGSEESYVKLMNEKAKELGLENTHFTNTIGIETSDNMHYSTVKDIAILLKYCLKNDSFKEIFMNDKYVTSDGLITLKSTKSKIANKYNMDLSFIKGSKTGYTKKAGLCLASISSYNDVNYLLVTAGASTENDNKINHFLDAKRIYTYYFDNYSYKKILKKGKVIKKIKTKYDEEIVLKASENVIKYLKNDVKENDLKYVYEGKTVLDKNIKKGDKIGKYVIKYKDKKLYEEDVLSPKTVKFKLKYKYKIIILIIITTIIFIKLFTKFLKKIK